jgi:hypothetical protein
VWNFFKTIIIAISLFTFILEAAFHFSDKGQTTILELFFDFVQLIDIFLVFFTAVPSASISKSVRKYFELKNAKNQPTVAIAIDAVPYFEKDMKIIALNYVTSYFTFDFLACVPGLLTNESLLVMYPFKILRVIRLPRILQFLQDIFEKIK